MINEKNAFNKKFPAWVFGMDDHACMLKLNTYPDKTSGNHWDVGGIQKDFRRKATQLLWHMEMSG